MPETSGKCVRGHGEVFIISKKNKFNMAVVLYTSSEKGYRDHAH